MRPQTLDDYIGQTHLTAPKTVLRSCIDQGSLPSLILYGPSGCGKTTLAYLLAKSMPLPFYTLSAVDSGVKELREIIGQKNSNLFQSQKKIIFIDEIHRFSKSQQDALLHAVENGQIILIGATTENPSYEINQALLSRLRVFTLKELGDDDITKIVQRAVAQDQLLQKMNIEIRELDLLIQYSNHDARQALNLLEMAVTMQALRDKIIIDDSSVKECLDKRMAVYDKKGDQHYNVISAFIKSIRGSDPNAAIYYLAVMLNAGEDILFIARRMVILAAEDVGLANPTALGVANACFTAVEKVGMPEARIILAQGVIYLATSPKSNSAYLAIDEALAFVEKNGVHQVPAMLHNVKDKYSLEVPTSEKYRYSHDFNDNGETHFAKQHFMPRELRSKIFYRPANNAREKEIEKKLKQIWANVYDYEVV